MVKNKWSSVPWPNHFWKLENRPQVGEGCTQIHDLMLPPPLNLMPPLSMAGSATSPQLPEQDEGAVQSPTSEENNPFP